LDCSANIIIDCDVGGKKAAESGRPVFARPDEPVLGHRGLVCNVMV
jgi:hypothetical protein